MQHDNVIVINPLETFPPNMMASWRRGYGDALRPIDNKTGRAAVVVDARGDWKNAEEGRIRQAEDKKRIVSSNAATITHVAAEIEMLKIRILSQFGRNRAPFLYWCMIWLYLLVAALAIASEFPLTMWTLSEVFNVSTEGMITVTKFGIWAIGVTAALITFALKILVEALEKGTSTDKVKHGVIIALCILSVVFSELFIVYIAGVRTAMEQEQRVQTDLTAAESAHNSAAAQRLRAERDEWAGKRHDRAGSAFRWLTIGLPILAAAAMIVALRQWRDYRAHNVTVRGTAKAEARIQELRKETSAAEAELAVLEKEIEKSAKPDAFRELFTDHELAYDHGYAHGAAEARSKLHKTGLYRTYQHGMMPVNV